MSTSGERVAVIGAGPYGLSVTANLRARGVPTTTFGQAMSFWQQTMPAGMLLRSSQRASSIHDPRRRLRIGDWARETGNPLGAPVPLESFTSYGLWFTQQIGDDIDPREVGQVRQAPGGFRLELSDGSEESFRRVVVASGLRRFEHVPPVFRDLPPEKVSHAVADPDLSRFAGRRLVIVGGGQSALESAALANEAGAEVQVLIRGRSIFWLGAGGPATNVASAEIPQQSSSNTSFRVRHGLYWRSAPTDIGGRFGSWLGAAPDVCRLLPTGPRERLSYDSVKPAAAHWLRERLRPVQITLGQEIQRARVKDEEVEITLTNGTVIAADHVLLGTGYRIDVSRYPFLPEELVANMDTTAGYPVLRRGLESSVPGLHFVGAPAYWSFGPTMRFVVGTAYAGPAVAERIAGERLRPFRWAF